MSRILIASLAACAILTTGGCANSVLNDPEEMARRHASVERDRARRDAFWSRFEGSPGSASQSRSGSPGLRQVGVTSSSQCRAAGGTWNTADNFCWRL